jgi:hypothetical protein
MRPVFRNLPQIAVISALALAPGCGGSSPAGPTPSTPTVTSVIVSGANSVSLGATAGMTATANRSDGSTEVVTSTAAWQSSNPAVATVSSQGQVTAASPGSAVISAAFAGRTGQLPVEVMAVDNVQVVVVVLDKVVIDGTCDTDSVFESPGDGEFSFLFEVERSGGGRTVVWRTDKEKFSRGARSIGGNVGLTFSRNVSRGEDFILWFAATEWDGALGPDAKLNDASTGRTYTYQDGGWVTNGSPMSVGSSACGATIHWSMSSRPQ